MASRILAACVSKIRAFHTKRTLGLLNLAIEEAAGAFLDPVLLPQLHFPGEHLYAVYLPLWMPLFLPLFFGVADEMTRRREPVGGARLPWVYA